jgi:hypothetical protein
MDRTTKILLAAIALGLWANAAATIVRPAFADVGSSIHNIETMVSNIYKGACPNNKIC